MQFQTARLWVHPLRQEDLPALTQLLLDPVVTKTYMVPMFSNAKEAEALSDRLLKLSQSGTVMVSGIYLQGRFIGLINETDRTQIHLELGYALLPEHYNCGYGTEVLQGSIEYLFSNGYHRVLTGAFAENTASLRVMEKCGMVKQAQTESIAYRGENHTCVYYAIEKRERPYYEAYDERYKQVHGRSLRWFGEDASPIVAQVMEAYGINKHHKLLELGCGEGRDAAALLRQGYDLTATDVSPAAIAFCKKQLPNYVNSFAVLDCVRGTWPHRYDFIFAVAVVHMLVTDEDRDGFYAFIRNHLQDGGVALICTMGDGTQERQSDPDKAFCLQKRVHEQTGTELEIAGTSCRMVTFETLEKELAGNGLHILQQGLTAVEPDFPVMMYAVVRAQ